MKRRDFIMLLGGTVTAWPLLARAQQQAMSMIGFVSSRSPGESAGVVAAFRQGLSEAGFVEGKNLTIAFRWAEGHYDRLPALMRELVGLRVAVLFAAGGPPSALSAKEATSTIPVVFSAVSDPVRMGLISSLNRPGGNLTGMSFLNSEIVAKSAQLLKEAVPATAVIAFLVNPAGPSAEIFAKEAPTAASALGIQIPVLNASTERELDEAFASLGKLGAVGLVVPAEPFFDSNRDKIVALAIRYAVPMIANLREYVVAGGLMSYGPSLPDLYRRAGTYVGRVLKGERPADLPVMQPTKFDLVLNLNTARTLGLMIPDKLIALAEEVIE
ncbi:MAG TPA: ABC transporter substrate-binding protein [Stellaceae bacterium]|nr:ABC transporter substrate-binding protein [Stellaceae bacterium]